jgi:glucose-1-phosphatase
MNFNKEEIKAVVFDFGNVIINIDLQKTFEAFAQVSLKTAEQVKKAFEESELFRKYETGLFNDEEFREAVRQILGFPLSDTEIDTAWNALLLDVPTERFEYLEKLRHKLPIYLLSNTSSIHIEKCKVYLNKKFAYSDFTKVFSHAFLSYEMGLWKPDIAIYQKVIDQVNLKPHEVLFLDDNQENINAAQQFGLKTIKINPPDCFTDILSKIFPDV